jgi:hypothetical protein
MADTENVPHAVPDTSSTLKQVAENEPATFDHYCYLTFQTKLVHELSRAAALPPSDVHREPSIWMLGDGLVVDWLRNSKQPVLATAAVRAIARNLMRMANTLTPCYRPQPRAGLYSFSIITRWQS